MANEVVYSGHAGLFNAAVVSPLVHALLSDYTDLRGTCVYKGSITGTGSSVVEVSKVNMAQAMADTSEASDAANQDLTTSSVNITVARKSIVREPSDLFIMAGGNGLNVQALAQSCVSSASLKFTDMLCALFSSVTAVKGTSGATLTYDDFRDAIEQLRISLVPGDLGIFCVLNPKQVNELTDSYRGETGVEIFRNQGNILNYSGPGYVGTLDGVDIISSDSVASDGTDYIGCMFGYTAFGYADGIPNLSELNAESDVAVVSAPDNAAVWVETNRNSRKGTNEIIGNYYVGVALLEDARACRIRSID